MSETLPAAEVLEAKGWFRSVMGISRASMSETLPAAEVLEAKGRFRSVTGYFESLNVRNPTGG